jgi:enoyl-CoA hydratase/carnithine racemase
MSDTVLYDITGEVGTITINRPEARNALTLEMYDRIAGICTNPGENGAVKALIVTGSGGRAFAAGTDIALFRAMRTKEDALAYEARIERVLTAIETCPVPTIAAIAGACTGGGATIAVACDLRIATQDARFGFPIARTLGNCLSSANYARLAAMIGAGRVMDLVLTARLADAEEGRAIGLYAELAANHAALMTRATDLARTMTGHAPLTMRATKEALRRLRMGRRDDEDLIAECYLSEDFREGLEAFLAKRTPDWKGR